MRALFPKIPKMQRPKPLKIIDVVLSIDTLSFVPLFMESLRISAKTLYCKKLEPLGYIYTADSLGLSSF